MSDTMVLKFIEEKGKIGTEVKEMLFSGLNDDEIRRRINGEVSIRAGEDIEELVAEACSSHYYGSAKNAISEKVFNYIKEGF